jgi:hypothetical protein
MADFFIQGTSDQIMVDHLGHKIINLGVAKLSNSSAKAGPMSKAIALGLTCAPRLDLDHFASQV